MHQREGGPIDLSGCSTVRAGDWRYTLPEMGAVWSEQAKFQS